VKTGKGVYFVAWIKTTQLRGFYAVITLPRAGDRGLTDGAARGSDFSLLLEGALKPLQGATSHYSRSNLAELDAELEPPVGGSATPVWEDGLSYGAPDWADVTVIRIVYDDTVTLEPNEIFTMTSGVNAYLFRLRGPPGVPESVYGDPANMHVAYSSFAVKARNDSFASTYTKSVEPYKVGLLTGSASLNKSVRLAGGNAADEVSALTLKGRTAPFEFVLHMPIPEDAADDYSDVSLRDAFDRAFVVDADGITVNAYTSLGVPTAIKGAGLFSFTNNMLTYLGTERQGPAARNCSAVSARP
jgi:hypothetical protein